MRSFFQKCTFLFAAVVLWSIFVATPNVATAANGCSGAGVGCNANAGSGVGCAGIGRGRLIVRWRNRARFAPLRRLVAARAFGCG